MGKKAESTQFYYQIPDFLPDADSIQIFSYYWYKCYISLLSAVVTNLIVIKKSPMVSNNQAETMGQLFIDL